MSNIKTWFVEVAIKKLGPSLIKGAMGAGLAYLAAKQGLLVQFGVVYDAAAQTLTLHLDTFQGWILASGTGLIMASLTAGQHATTAVITGKPLSGDVRVNPDQPVDGGNRSGDPPKAA